MLQSSQPVNRFSCFFKVKKQNTVYVAGIGVRRLKGPRAPPEEDILYEHEAKKDRAD